MTESKTLKILGENGERWVKGTRHAIGKTGEDCYCLDRALKVAYPDEAAYNQKAEAVSMKIGMKTGKKTVCPHKWTASWNDRLETQWRKVKAVILAAGV